MPENPLFPSLNLELGQISIDDQRGPLPDYNFQGQLSSLQSIYGQIVQLKGQHPLLKKGKGNTVTQEDFLFPSIKKSLGSTVQVSDIEPVGYDPEMEQMDRYAGSSHFKDLGFLPGRDNEELYGQNQGTWEAIGNGITQAYELAKFQFVDQVKGWGRLVDGIFSADLSKIYDDGDLDDVNKKMEQIMNDSPIFMTKHDQNSIFTGKNLANLIGQTGFTLGALSEIVAEELILSAVTAATAGGGVELQGVRSTQLLRNLSSAFKRMAKLEEIATDASKMRKVFNSVASATPLTGTLRTFIQGARAEENTLQFAARGFGAFYRDIREANAAFTEARAESSGTYEQQKDYLEQQLLDSGQKITPDKLERIDKIARESADANFWANAAIIGISNRIQFDNVFRGFKGAAKYLDEVGNIGEDAAGYFKRSTLPFTKNFLRTAKAEVLSRPLRYFRNNITEALQENLQGISNDSVQAYYRAYYDNPATANTQKAISNAISGQFSTEGAKTFLSGFLVGAIASPIQKIGTASINRISTTSEQRKMRRENVAKTVGALNSFFSTAEGKNATIQTSLAQAMGEAVKQKDQKGFQDIKDHAIRDFARTAIETGKVESLFDRLESVAKGLTDEEFKKAFGIEASESNKRTVRDYVDGLRSRTARIARIKEELDFKFGNPFIPTGKETPEELQKVKTSRQAYENAKWQFLFMQDAHLRTLERQKDILSEVQKGMPDVEYNAIFTLTDPKRASAEVKILRQEAGLISDPKIKEQKLKRATFISALLPQLKKGTLDPKTFQEYINHVQESNNRLPVDLSTITDNLTRLEDFFKLKGDESRLFDNINHLVDPKNFVPFFERHFDFMAADEFRKAAVKQTNDEVVKPVAQTFPELEIKINDEGDLEVKDKEGKDAPQDIKDEVEQKLNEQANKLQEDRAKADAEKAKIKQRLSDIYDTLVDKGVIDQQDRDYLARPEVIEEGKENADFQKIMQILNIVPPDPESDVSSKKKAAIETESSEESSEEDDDAYPYYEGSDTITEKIPEVSLQTIVQELRNQEDRDANGDVALQGGYANLRGEIVRLFLNHPELFEGYQFVLQKDNPAFYEHASDIPQATQDELDVFDSTSPYKFFLKEKKTANSVVLFIKDKKGDFVYFNPNEPGLVTSSKSGLIAAFPLNIRKSGIDAQDLFKFIESQKNQQYVISPKSITASGGAFMENKGKLRSLKTFLADVPVEDRGDLRLSKGLKDEVWNHPDNTRNGGAFIQIGNLNPIKLLPSKLSEVVLPDGKKFNLKAILEREYTGDEGTKVLDNLRKIIYSGPFRNANGPIEKVLLQHTVDTKTGKMKIFLVRMVDTTPEIKDSAKKTFVDSKMSSETITNYLLSGRRMNVKKSLGADIDVPVVDDKGALSFEAMSYYSFLADNLFTNKARTVHPDGRITVNPINNFFHIPGLKNIITTKPALQVSAEKVAEKMTAPQPEVKKEEALVDKKADIERRRQVELNDLQSDVIALRKVTTEETALQALETALKVKGKTGVVNDAGALTGKSEMGSMLDLVSLAKRVADGIEKIQQKQVDKLNAKYDAELAALETPDKNTIKARAEQNLKVTEIEKQRTRELDKLDIEIDLPVGFAWTIKTRDENKNRIPGEVLLVNEQNNVQSTLGELLTRSDVPYKLIIELEKVQKEIDKINDAFQKKIDELNVPVTVKVEEKKVSNTSIDPIELAKKMKGDQASNKSKGKPDFDALTKIKDATDRALIGNEELQFIKDRFGDHVLQHLAYSVNSNYWGYWSKGAITLFKDAQEGVGYHESWHHFSQMFLTFDEKMAIYKEAIDALGIKGVNFTSPEVLKGIEEHLAEEFKRFAQSGGTILPITPAKRNIFQKIWDFLVHLFTGKKGLNDYFKDLYTGTLSSYHPSMNNTMWGRLNYGFAVEQEGKMVEIFDARELALARGFFNTMLHEAFTKNEEGSLKDQNLTMATLVGLRDKPELKKLALQEVYKAVRVEIGNYLISNAEMFRNKPAGLSIVQNMHTFFDEFFNYAMNHLQIESNIDNVADLSEVEEAGEAPVTNDENAEESNIEDTENIDKDQVHSDRVVPIEDKGLLATLSKVMRNLVVTIPKAEAVMEDGVVVDARPAINEYGLSEPCDYYRVVNILGEELAGLFDDHKIMDKLRSEDLMQRLPEVKFIIDALPSFDRPTNFGQQTISSIVRDFNRVNVPVYSLIQRPDGSFLWIEQTKNTERKIQKEWQDNFLSSAAVLVDEKTGNRYLDAGFVKSNSNLLAPQGSDDKNFNSRIEYLSRLGIRFSDRTKKTGRFRRLVLGNGFSNFTQSLAERIELKQNIESPVADLRRAFAYEEQGEQQYTKNENFFISEMIRLESLFSDRTPNNMYKTAKGTNKYALMLPNRFNIVMDGLKKATKLSDLTQRKEMAYLNDRDNYYLANSFLLRSLFVKGVKQNDIEFGDYNSSRLMSYDKKVEKQTTELTGREKLIMDMNAFLGYGAIDIMRTGSSQSSYFFKLNKYVHNYQFGPKQFEKVAETKILPFSHEFYDKGKPTSAFSRALRGYFYNLLVDELSVMKLSNTGNEEFDSRLKKFGIFDDILPFVPGLKDKLRKAIIDAQNPADIREATIDILPEVMTAVNAYLRKQTDDFVAYATKFGIVAEANGTIPRQIDPKIATRFGTTWRGLVYNFILNDFVMNVEFSRIMASPVQFYTDFHKRAQTITSTGNTANSGNIVKEYLRSTNGRTMAAALGKPFNENIDETRIGVFQSDISTLDERLAASWREAAKLAGREKEMEDIIREYAKIDTNDGQAWCSFDFYRQFRIQVGNWNMETDEKEYIKQVTAWKIQKGLYRSEEEKKQWEKLVASLSDKVYSTFPVMKVQYEGPLKSKGVMKHVLHKFSIAPLIPSVYQDTELGKVHDWMLDNNYDYTTAKSGSKLYNQKVLEFWQDPELRENFKVTPSEPDVVFSSLLKEQIKTNSGIKAETTWGTQLRSLFLSNVFSSGKVDPKWDEAKITKLFDEYFGGLTNLVNAEREKLFKEFGITEKGEQITISNTQRFVSTLQKQAELRNLNDNIKQSIGYDPITGGFTVPLEIVTNRQSIIDLIGGLIFRKLVSIKTNGDMLIQISSTGTRKQGEKELSFYEPIIKAGKLVAVKPAGCKVAMNEYFRPLLNLRHRDSKPIATRERLNEMLRDETWKKDHAREITLIGYRIPTQEPNSMEYMHIEEFLPDEFGSCIIVPREIVVKAGSDFDVDKLSIFRPSYLSNGRIVSDETNDDYKRELRQKAIEVEGEISKLKRDFGNDPVDKFIAKIFAVDEKEILDEEVGELTDRFNEFKTKYFELDRLKKAVATNKAVDAYITSLSSPEMFFQLIRPNNTNTVKPLAIERALQTGEEGFTKDGVSDFTNTKIFEYKSNHIKFLQNIQGKNDLSMFALLNKMLQNVQKAGLKLNAKFKHYYTVYTKDQNEGGIAMPTLTRQEISTTPWLLTKEERALVESNGWDISQNRDMFGRYKQQIVSELMNATVDIAKNPFYIGLGINNYNKGVAGMLILYGVPIERISAFLKQPILQEYYRRLTVEPYRPFDQDEDAPDGEKKAYLANNVHARELLNPALKNRAQLEGYIAKIQAGFLDKTVAYQDVFTEDELVANIGKDNYDTDSQKIILGHFLAIQRIQQVYRTLQDLVTTDTKKIATPIAAANTDLSHQRVKDTQLFQEEGLTNILTRSFTSPFTMKEMTKRVFSTIMPYGFSNKFSSAVALKVKRSNLYMTKAQMLKLEKTAGNDFMLYMVLEKGTYKSQKLKDYVWSQLNKKVNSYTLVRRLIGDKKNDVLGLREKYPALFSYYSLAEKIHSNVSTKQPLENIELTRGLDNSSEMQNIFIQDFNRLINFRQDSIPGYEYTADQAEEIRSFFRDLAIVAFGQSGFNKSMLYFTDVLPLSELEPITLAALKQYKEEINSDPTYEDKFIEEFLRDFAAQNPSFGLPTGRTSNEEPFRGKYLKPKVVYTPVQEEEAKPEEPQLPATKFKIPMNFEDGTGGRKMRPEFKGKSTLQLIKEGNRTATSRDRSKSYNQQDIKVGDIIEFYANQGKSKGETVLVRVTKAPYKLSEVTAEQWSKLEGWQPTNFEKLKEEGYEQFQFELIDEPQEPKPEKKAPKIISVRHTPKVEDKPKPVEEGFLPLEKWTRSHKKEKFTVIEHTDSGPKEVEGYKVSVEGHPDMSSFVHRTEYGGWAWVDTKTGFNIATSVVSLKEAIANGINTINTAMTVNKEKNFPILIGLGITKKAPTTLATEKYLTLEGQKLTKWLGINVTESDIFDQAVHLSEDESVIAVNPSLVKEQYEKLTKKGVATTQELYQNFLVFRHLANKYMRLSDQNDDETVRHRFNREATERTRLTGSPENSNYQHIMLAIPVAFMNAHSSKSFDEFNEKAKDMIAAYSKNNPNPTTDQLNSLFEQLSCL